MPEYPAHFETRKEERPKTTKTHIKGASDVDRETDTIRRRAEHEKTGYEHMTPMSAEAKVAIEFSRGKAQGLALLRYAIKRELGEGGMATV